MKMTSCLTKTNLNGKKVWTLILGKTERIITAACKPRVCGCYCELTEESL